MQREPAVAGRFYQARPEQLRQQIKECFAHQLGVGQNVAPATGRLLAFIAPHAGYMFSGPVASHAFARMRVEKPQPTTLVLLGPKHTHHGARFSVSAAASWKTPLGNLPVDQTLCRRLVAAVSELELDDGAHLYEHSLEVQLPFAQYSLDNTPKIVPIAFAYDSFEEIASVAAAIGKVLAAEPEGSLCIVCSSDFSHDTPRDEAYRLDAEVIKKITSLDARGFYNLIVSEDRSVCGLMPITALLVMLHPMKVAARLLKYATSMDVMDHDRGVGYAAIIFEENG
ncbi:MAG TPA: AmmeMemoRadiSam system protein B [Candidatus Riflebacteria bacterium]|jgi:AmmeMemoRadiSam system protein B|nr:AmmeMemoRadiSam system protein B [Candidatus Riflebacteria bacterium]